MKNVLLPLFVTMVATACDPLGTWDDIWLPWCLPNQIKITHCEITQWNKIVTFKVLTASQGCDPKIAVPIRFDVHGANGTVAWFVITDNTGKIWDDSNDVHNVANLQDKDFTVEVTTTNPDALFELDAFTEGQNGEYNFDDAPLDCDPPCIINDATDGACTRVDNNTTYTIFTLLSTLSTCTGAEESDIWITVTAPWWVAWYNISSNGGTLSSNIPGITVPAVPGTQFSWSIDTNTPGAIPTIQIRKKDDQGNQIVLHTYTLDECPREPPCENQITWQCNILTNNNTDIISQVSFENCTPFSAEICFLADFPLKQWANIHRTLVNTETGDIVQLPNQWRTPNGINITVPAGKWTLSVQAWAAMWTQIPVSSTVFTKIRFPNSTYNLQNGIFGIFPPNDNWWFSVVTATNVSGC